MRCRSMPTPHCATRSSPALPAATRAAAPAIDILAPDIYQNDPAAYLKVLNLYHRDDNALFVPETGGAANARFFFSALGLQAIGYSPFGMDFTADRKSTRL